MSRLARKDDAVQTVENLSEAFEDWFDAHAITSVMGNTVRSEYSTYQPFYGEEYDSNWDDV